MSVKERLLQFIKRVGSNPSRFEKDIGQSNGYVNNIRQSISPDVLDKILLKYPQLNKTWLIFGEGEMTKSASPENPMDILIKAISELVESNKTLALTNREQWMVINSGEFGKVSSPDLEKETNIYDAARGEEFQLSGSNELPLKTPRKKEKKGKTIDDGK